MWDRHSSQQNVLDRFCLGKIYSNFVHNEDGIFKFFYDSTLTLDCNLILGLFIFMKAILLYINQCFIHRC